MRGLSVIIFLISLGWSHPASAQEMVNATLLKADKLYIKKAYAEAIPHYVKYLNQFPKDYYASRQTAVCYDQLNDPNNAIDYWPIVVESSEVTEKDYLAYGKSLLANNRLPEAKKVFLFLSKSKDKSVAAWGKSYLNPAALPQDTIANKVYELMNVNTELSESCPVIFKEKLFYISDPLPSRHASSPITAFSGQSIKVSVQKDSIHFLPSLLYEKIQTLNMYGQFCFSPDGNWMYFAKVVSNKELSVKSENPFFRYQIFVLNMNSIYNPLPEIVAFKYNLPEYDFLHPAISKDGKHLFFASNKKGSVGGTDIYMCERQNNDWTEPVNLGMEVNSTGNESYPHFSADSVLYFSSDQLPGFGGLDVFYSERNSGERTLFKTAKNAGAPLNSRFDDFGLFIMPGGKALYFSSRRKENTNTDLYFYKKG